MIHQLLLFTFSLFSPCDQLPIEEEIKEREVIAIVKLENRYNKRLLTILQSFKGFPGSHLVLTEPYEFELDKEYLIFVDEEKGEYSLAPCSWTAPLEVVNDITLDRLNNLRCFDPDQTIEAVIKRHREKTKGKGLQLTAACTREFDPMCGCDGKTYGNICELDHAGIMKYVPGACQ